MGGTASNPADSIALGEERRFVSKIRFRFQSFIDIFFKKLYNILNDALVHFSDWWKIQLITIKIRQRKKHVSKAFLCSCYSCFMFLSNSIRIQKNGNDNKKKIKSMYIKILKTKTSKLLLRKKLSISFHHHLTITYRIVFNFAWLAALYYNHLMLKEDIYWLSKI